MTLDHGKAAGREEGRAPIRYVSLFSGIEAASCAWHPLGWEALAFAEIEPFPSAVLAHRWPGVPNLGDVTKANWAAFRGKADVLVGGPPCQAFSVAGLRESLNDDRGNMTLKFIEACDAVDPRYVVYENVPGILSTKDNAFGCFLGALVGADSALVPPRELGWTDAGVVAGPRRVAAWRILDAQFFGVPQRRRRVFVVACPRDGADPSQVLFECAGVHRNFETGRKAREDAAGALAASLGGSDENDAADGRLIQAFGGNRTSGPLDVATAVRAKGGTGHGDFESETFIAATLTSKPYADHEAQDSKLIIAHALRSERSDASEDGTGRGTPLVPVAVRTSQTSANGHGVSEDVAHTLDSIKGQAVLAAVAADLQNVALTGDKTGTLDTSRPGRGGGQAVLAAQAFRAHMGGAPSNAMNLSDQAPTLDRNTPAVLAFDTTQITSPENRCQPEPGDPHPLAAGAHPPAIAYALRSDAARDGQAKTPSPDAEGRVRLRDPGFNVMEECSPTIDAGAAPIAFHTTQDPISGPQVPAIGAQSRGQGVAGGVRRLTPRECERLQGFADDWTLVPYHGKPADGPRYRAIGNSMAVPCMAWIGRRIEAVEHLLAERAQEVA